MFNKSSSDASFHSVVSCKSLTLHFSGEGVQRTTFKKSLKAQERKLTRYLLADYEFLLTVRLLSQCLASLCF